MSPGTNLIEYKHQLTDDLDLLVSATVQYIAFAG